MSTENFSTKLGSETNSGGAGQHQIKVVCNVVNNYFQTDTAVTDPRRLDSQISVKDARKQAVLEEAKNKLKLMANKNAK